MSDYYQSEEFMAKAKAFKKFTFRLRFNKEKIALVSSDEQIDRGIAFLTAIGALSPVLENWYLSGESPAAARRFNVVENPDYLRKEVGDWLSKQDGDMRRATQYSLWNGEEDVFRGGVSISYFAHDINFMPSYIDIDDAGALVMALPDAQKVLLGMIRAAVDCWPEIEWGVIVPEDYFSKFRIFKDRLTAGWIGYCPQHLRHEDFPEAHEIITVPGRGSILVSCPTVMDEKSKAHYERVGDIDTKLVELGYLPMLQH